MNRNKAISTVVFGLVLAGGACATGVWADEKPANGPSGSPSQSEEDALPPRIEATPLGSDVVTGWTGDEILNFVFNNDGDRLGAEYINTEAGDDFPADHVKFIFPQLTLDRNAGTVLLGKTVVGYYRGFHWRLLPGYDLKSKITSQVEDQGFDREKVCHLSVYLERRQAKRG
jgi:hypothetical protein